MKHLKKTHRRYAVIIFLGLSVVIGATVVVATTFMQPRKVPAVAERTAVPAAHPLSISSRTVFFGNSYVGRYINEWSMASPLKLAYPFSRLHEFDRENYDAWITGLECPTVADRSLTAAQEEATLAFNCNPAYIPEMAKWFTAVTLANNHTDNQGEEGFTATQRHLEENNIQYFGHYDPRSLADICETIALPVTVRQSDDTTSKGTLPVAMCGHHGVFRVPTDESMAIMERYARVMPVFALPHMGKEYTTAPDEIKTTTYRALIDHGADMVLGDHPHWIQTTEAYKGHPIIYSMGNFMFDQQDTREVTRSAGINVVINTTNVSSEQLSGWLALGKACSAYHDTCLDTIEKKGLEKLPLTYELSVIGTTDHGKITKPATASEQQDILARLHWADTITGLAAPYTGK